MKKKFVIFSMFFLIVGLFGLSMAQASAPVSSGISGEGSMGNDEAGVGTDQLAVVTKTKLATENAGEVSNFQNRVEVKAQLMAGNYELASGKQLMVQTRENNQFELKIGSAKAMSGLDIKSEENGGNSKLSVELSNGRNAEIKVMPDSASEKALERLGLKTCAEENGCAIELKEVGRDDKAKLLYELRTQRESKVLGLIRAQMNVQAQVDAENGEVISVKKPWWAFLAAEPEM